jgi:hypothetical protein
MFPVAIKSLYFLAKLATITIYNKHSYVSERGRKVKTETQTAAMKFQRVSSVILGLSTRLPRS